MLLPCECQAARQCREAECPVTGVPRSGPGAARRESAAMSFTSSVDFRCRRIDALGELFALEPVLLLVPDFLEPLDAESAVRTHVGLDHLFRDEVAPAVA